MSWIKYVWANGTDDHYRVDFQMNKRNLFHVHTRGFYNPWPIKVFLSLKWFCKDWEDIFPRLFPWKSLHKTTLWLSPKLSVTHSLTTASIKAHERPSPHPYTIHDLRAGFSLESHSLPFYVLRDSFVFRVDIKAKRIFLHYRPATFITPSWHYRCQKKRRKLCLITPRNLRLRPPTRWELTSTIPRYTHRSITATSASHRRRICWAQAVKVWTTAVSRRSASRWCLSRARNLISWCRRWHTRQRPRSAIRPCSYRATASAAPAA